MTIPIKTKYFLPQEIVNQEIYHEDWIDFNKNGIMDPYENPKLPIENRVDDLLSRMNLMEKVGQLGSGFDIPEPGIGNLTHISRGLGAKEGAIKGNEFQERAIEKTRLGVPVIVHDECLHGCVAKFSTSFPQAIGLGATWDPALVYKVSQVIAEETVTRGIHQCLSPVVNIARDVRGGRTEESYAEDPYLTSMMGAAFCQAMREKGVVATPKHFAANFVGDGGRDSNEIHFSERILRETFFPGFKACVKAGALSVMAAYNSIDGTPCSSNKWLLVEVLRDEWSFEGFVVSDYGSVNGILSKHHVVATPEEGAKVALESGLDVELPITDFFGEPLLEAIRKGFVPQEVLDEAVRRILRVKFLIGLFDRPFVNPNKAEEVCGSTEHSDLALQAAREAIVLLKDEGGLLPLDKGKIRSIAVLGPLSNELKLGGYSTVPLRGVTPLEGIKSKAKQGTDIYHASGSPITIGKHFPISSEFLVPSDARPGEHGLRGEYFDNISLSGDPVIVRIDESVNFNWGAGSPDPRIPSDNFSVRWTGKLVPPQNRTYEINLTTDDGVRFWLDNKLLIDSWHDRGATSDIVRIALEGGREYDIKIEYYEHLVDAVAELSWDFAFSMSTEILQAAELARRADVAVVFVGVFEGEGKDRARLELPGPQEALVEQVLNTGTPTVVVLVTGSVVTGEWMSSAPAIIQAWYPGQEGGTAIAEVLFGEYNPGGRLPFTWPRYVGQLPLYYNYKPTGRGYDYVDMTGVPLFPFGYGLSYTEFTYSGLSLKVDQESGNVKIELDVQNVGSRQGDEVVQLYIHDVVASVARPVMELRGFKRLTLKPSEKKTVSFAITPDDLAMLDAEMRRTVEPGEFEIMIGSSSQDIRLSGTFNVKSRITSDFDCAEMKPEKIKLNPGERTTVIIRVKNISQVSDRAHVRLLVDGREVESKMIDLSPREERLMRFHTQLRKWGRHELAVGLPEPKVTRTVQVLPASKRAQGA